MVFHFLVPTSCPFLGPPRSFSHWSNFKESPDIPRSGPCKPPVRPKKQRLQPLNRYEILLMEDILHQLTLRIFHFSQGFIYNGWCRSSSINTMSSIHVMYNCYISDIPLHAGNFMRLHFFFKRQTQRLSYFCWFMSIKLGILLGQVWSSPPR